MPYLVAGGEKLEFWTPPDLCLTPYPSSSSTGRQTDQLLLIFFLNKDSYTQCHWPVSAALQSPLLFDPVSRLDHQLAWLFCTFLSALGLALVSEAAIKFSLSSRSCSPLDILVWVEVLDSCERGSGVELIPIIWRLSGVLCGVTGIFCFTLQSTKTVNAQW